MGLLNLIPPDNKLSQLLMGFQQPLNDLGVGLARGKTWQKGIREASKYTEEQAPLRAEQAQLQMKAETDAKNRNQTAAFLRTQPGGAQFADAIENGAIDGGAAYKSWLEASKGQQPTANMQDWQFAQTNPGYAEFLNPPKDATSNQPASVQEYQFAQSQGYDKDYQTFIQEKGRNAGTPPATIAKEIFEADEGAQAGQNVIAALDQALKINATAWDGPAADLFSSTTALLGKQDDPTTQAAVQTQELKNLVTANALESLKATFGAAPTEGERKILLEVQGSINQPRSVRKAIFERARAAAERRLKFNRERGSSLRGGDYFAPGYSPVGGGSDTGSGDVENLVNKWLTP